MWKHEHKGSGERGVQPLPMVQSSARVTSGNNHSPDFSNMVAFHHGPVHYEIKFIVSPVLLVCPLISCLACPILKKPKLFWSFNQSKISLLFVDNHFHNLITIQMMINLKILSLIYRNVLFSWRTKLKAVESKLTFLGKLNWKQWKANQFSISCSLAYRSWITA